MGGRFKDYCEIQLIQQRDLAWLFSCAEGRQRWGWWWVLSWMHRRNFGTVTSETSSSFVNVLLQIHVSKNNLIFTSKWDAGVTNERLPLSGFTPALNKSLEKNWPSWVPQWPRSFSRLGHWSRTRRRILGSFLSALSVWGVFSSLHEMNHDPRIEATVVVVVAASLARQ